MLTDELFRRKMADLTSCLPLREGSDPESIHRVQTYHRGLRDLDDQAFGEACDRILFLDQWFPVIARIREVADECRRDRATRRAALAGHETQPTLVCGTCHGARWVRLGGADPLNMHAGDEGSRARPCPHCTTDGRFDATRERIAIAKAGGVRPGAVRNDVDLTAITWPERMAELHDPQTDRLDMDKLYRLSRELRGLDPDLDERPARVGGWQRAGDRR